VQNRNEQAKGRILIVDDEFHSARAAASVLTKAGYQCETYPTVDAALAGLDYEGADVIVANMRMPGVGWISLKKYRPKNPT
jgi:DNA-binding NtrC family response regulator